MTCNHADEKHFSTHRDERHNNSKTFFDANVKVKELGLFQPVGRHAKAPKDADEAIHTHSHAIFIGTAARARGAHLFLKEVPSGSVSKTLTSRIFAKRIC